MKTEDTYIENLIKKFFEGKTSNGEEKELSLYFSGENIPDHLKQHKGFFLYYGNGFMREVEEIKRPLVKNTLKRRWVKIRTIAALTVAAIFVFAIIFPFVKLSGDHFNPYAGSYMLVNGEKIYNLELIKQQEKEIRMMIAARESEYREIYSQSELKKNELKNIMRLKNK
jgi:hypothetical protein